MNVTPERTPRWERGDYQIITGAHYDGARLTVTFANGDDVRISVDRLVRGAARHPRWDELRATTRDIVVPTDEGNEEVSWMDVRAHSDPEFAEFLVGTADAEARRIGRRLRALRERRRMTAKEVAERAGIAPLSLSRIELGRHDVVYRTLGRILAAMGYTLKDLAQAADPTLAPKLRRAGVAQAIIERLNRVYADRPDSLVEAVIRIFGWSREQLAGEGLPAPPRMAAGYFKSQTNQNPRLATYTLWANWIALLVDQAIPRPPVQIPESAHAIRDDILRHSPRLRFSELLAWCWDHAIAVIPLDDPGEFHGAIWEIDGRAVIVLKQQTPWESRWTFDLAHETGHVARHMDQAIEGFVESREIAVMSEGLDADEQEASEFAAELLLGDPDGLARELARRTRGSLPRLKREVQRLAEERHLEVDALASYMSWRLTNETQDWWATAASLQIAREPRASVLARDVLRMRIQWDLLGHDDAAVLREVLRNE